MRDGEIAVVMSFKTSEKEEIALLKIMASLLFRPKLNSEKCWKNNKHAQIK